ncbi:ABC transporter substrate-binding protein [Shewanella avicenniae]|uniref:ABC transporter substrate-binding protein n=1 Tax=Shewanella avicenniae TaxID=2814294 RepID=A0ABX7QWH6_9GAMM|nr:ABC transporter substrate-binding protein [Shewanella avicenniae]QSX35306.1 ABC transporter substrate-binding protein [Shewanella avicenniae]
MERLLLLVFALLGLVLLVLGQTRTSISEFIPAERTFKIGVSMTPLSSPVIIADRLGYFADEKLEVLLEPYKGGNACFEALIRFDVDLATSSDSVMMFNSFKRNDFVALASIAQSDNDVKIMMRADGDIDSLEDIAGKKIAIVKGSASEYFFDMLMMLHNLHTTTVNIDLPPNEQGAALMARAVDVISIWEPYSYHLQQNYPGQVKTLDTQGYYTLSFNLIARKPDNMEYQKEHFRILRALQRAIEYIHSNPQQAQVIIAEYLNVPRMQVAGLWSDYLFRLSLDNTLVSTLNAQARWAIYKGFTEQEELPDYRLYIDPLALNEALYKPLVRTK